MSPIEQLQANIGTIESSIGYVFQNKDLILSAFLHRSYLNENKDLPLSHNERLEFLGDTVMGLIVSEMLYHRFPENEEGDLSFLRSRLIEAGSCVAYLRALGVEKFVLLGRGERMNDGRGRESIQADLFEALIGAIYLDGGFEASRKFFLDHLGKELEGIIEMPVSNYKAVLQDYAQKQFQQQPVYQVLSESGPDHSKCFEVAVVVNSQVLGVGTGTSKKEAQQEAARRAVEKINENKSTI